jgi:hypothetical protein
MKTLQGTKKFGTVASLAGRRRVADRAAARDALARRQRGAALDVVDEEVERALRMRLDELELREVEVCL